MSTNRTPKESCSWRDVKCQVKDPVLRVLRATEYSGPAPVMGTPTVVGGYSVDGDRRFVNDRSELQFVHSKYLPENEMAVKMDLNTAYEGVIPFKGTAQESLENFLRWILENEGALVSEESPQRLSTDVICLRGTLKQIMKTPYVRKFPWSILVREFKGSFYIVYKGNRANIVDQTVASWGHRFEQYMKGNPDERVDTNKEYRCVLKLPLGDWSFLFAPEVDCADRESFEEDFQDLRAFVTVKCCQETSPERMTSFRRRKLSDYWVENHLSGIPRTIVGFRTYEGIVHTLQLLKTDEMPEKGNNEWEPNVYFNFLICFLNFMKEQVMTDPAATHKFEFIPDELSIRCEKLEQRDLLPAWYTERLFNSNSSD